uniref:Integrase catalytic domain-containing protein n=1 Tax=Poecilia latipinna TaxID=48699 RepID=A0A3B3V397_9TELE
LWTFRWTIIIDEIFFFLKDVWAYIKACVTCQKYKPDNKKPAGLMQPTPVTEAWEKIGVDLMGPLPRSKNGNKYLLVIIDYFTKWIEVFSLKESKAQKITSILKNEIFTCFGVPQELVSDRGPQFTCPEMENYHPQANLTERSNRTIKTMIASFVGEHHSNWDQWIQEFRFAINAAQHETTGRSPAELTLGRPLKGPLERIIGHSPSPQQTPYKLLDRHKEMTEQVKRKIGLSKVRQAKYYNARRRSVQLFPGDLVWVRSHPLSKATDKFSSKLAPKWSGPAVMRKQLGPVNYQIQPRAPGGGGESVKQKKKKVPQKKKKKKKKKLTSVNKIHIIFVVLICIQGCLVCMYIICESPLSKNISGSQLLPELIKRNRGHLIRKRKGCGSTLEETPSDGPRSLQD